MAKASNISPKFLTSIVDAYRSSSNRLLLLDYDGTLVSYAPRPEQAKPSTRTLSVIAKLASDTRNTITIISGRQRKVLDAWLGHLPVQFVAEHGAFEKTDGIWRTAINLNLAWKEKIMPIMQHYSQTVAGSLLEEKETALVYHYRGAVNRAEARNTACELLEKLKPATAKLHLRVTHADMAIEVRGGNTDKGKAALAGLEQNAYDFVLCAGDSKTDEDMFAIFNSRKPPQSPEPTRAFRDNFSSVDVLPSTSSSDKITSESPGADPVGPASLRESSKLTTETFCIKVGPGQTSAKYRVGSPEALISVLATLAEARG